MHIHAIILAATVCAAFFSASTIKAQTPTKVKGSDVVINGDSFFALSGEIKTDLEKFARADGYIGSSETFRCINTDRDPLRPHHSHDGAAGEGFWITNRSTASWRDCSRGVLS